MERRGFPDSVLWNPYGNEAMGFDKFVCVEPVQAGPISIPADKNNAVKFYQKISCVKMWDIWISVLNMMDVVNIMHLGLKY